MSAPTTIAVVLIGLVLLWLLAGVVLRFGGLLLFFSGVIQLGLGADAADGFLVAALGCVLWLVGQWHYALRHQEFKSPLARHLFARLPAFLDPARGWGVAAVDAGAPRRRREAS